MSTLECLNLTKNDSIICEIILRSGEIEFTQIQKLTSLHRRNIYDSLNRLIARGFISPFLTNGKTTYVSNHQKIIYELEEKKGEISTLIPQIHNFSKSEKIPIHVWTGDDIFKKMLDDELQVNKEIFVFSVSTAEKRIWELYNKTSHSILTRGPSMKILFIEGDENISNVPFLVHAKARVLPKKYYSSLGIEVYGSVTCLIFTDQILRIDNLDLANQMKLFFNTLWKIAKKV